MQHSSPFLIATLVAPLILAFPALVGTVAADTVAAPADDALALPAPSGPVLLTLSGAIATGNQGGSGDHRAAFDLAMLQAMEPVTITTTTIWTDGPQAFTGVPLNRLLKSVGANGSALHAQALNDYGVDIPMSDVVEGGPIVAFAMNGEPMPVREKGPLWIIYPFDAKPEYQTEVIYSRAIWQLDRITIAP